MIENYLIVNPDILLAIWYYGFQHYSSLIATWYTLGALLGTGNYQALSKQIYKWLFWTPVGEN